MVFGLVIASMNMQKLWIEPSHPCHIHVNRISNEQRAMTICLYSFLHLDLDGIAFSVGITAGMCVPSIALTQPLNYDSISYFSIFLEESRRTKGVGHFLLQMSPKRVIRHESNGYRFSRMLKDNLHKKISIVPYLK